jgi:hypothetical protein
VSESQTSKQCYQCGKHNPDQAFCGVCGSPLALSEYISAKVDTQLGKTIRDRDVLEMDSSIKVFKQAWGWLKLILGTAVGLLVLAGGGVAWKASDFWSGAEKAKQSVADTAKKNSDDIARVSSQSKQDISKALEAAKTDITTASSDAVRQSQSTKAEISKGTASFRRDLEGSRLELQAASKLQPEVESIRKQLSQATDEMQAQQKVISSSEEFVKSVFSTHLVDIFNIGQAPQDRYAVIPAIGTGNTVVLLLLRNTPIQGTIQLQQHIYVQPPYSYLPLVHNLVIFFWGDAPASLQTKPLFVSYFPSMSDKELIHSLSQHDGRWYADDQPLPKFNQPDPDFRGNKWMPISPTPAKP